jgi:hypothetical protein
MGENAMMDAVAVAWILWLFGPNGGFTLVDTYQTLAQCQKWQTFHYDILPYYPDLEGSNFICLPKGITPTDK